MADRYEFSVSLDGTASTYIGQVGDTYSGDDPYFRFTNDLAAGSVYSPLSGGVAANVRTTKVKYSGDWSSDFLCYRIGQWPDGQSQPQPSYSLIPPGTVVGRGRSGNLFDGRYLVMCMEVAVQPPPPVPPAIDQPWADYNCEFVGVDQIATPPTVETIALNYFGIPAPDANHTIPVQWLGHDCPEGCSRERFYLTTDQNSGLILIAAVTENQYNASGQHQNSIFTTMLWVIQGPRPMPNLSGEGVGVWVMFS